MFVMRREREYGARFFFVCRRFIAVRSELWVGLGDCGTPETIVNRILKKEQAWKATCDAA